MTNEIRPPVGERIRNYFRRIFDTVPKWQLIFWWILRLAMIFALIDTVFGIFPKDSYKGSNPPAQIFANLVGMFGYEIVQLLPKKNRLRFFTPTFQNVSALGFFLGSFGGAYLNLYYALPMFDKILHAYGTAEAVYIGYEYLSATQLKFKKTAPHQIVTLGALGFGFVLANAWELFEFIYDQFFGGDAQHWDYQKALEQAGGIRDNIFQMIPLTEEMWEGGRFALMDTMDDIVLNFIGGFLMYIILVIYPYRHRGKNDVNALIERQNAAEISAEADFSE